MKINKLTSVICLSLSVSALLLAGSKAVAAFQTSSLNVDGSAVESSPADYASARPIGSLSVGQADGGWQAQLELNVIPDQLRVKLNGKQNTHLFKTSGKGLQAARLAPDNGLRYGRNALKVTAVYQGRIYPAKTVIFEVKRSQPLASAGPDRRIGLATPVKLNARHSIPLSQIKRVEWRILSAPFGSQVALPQPDKLRTTFTPDLLGNYQIELSVHDRATGAVGRDVVTVTATSASLATPLVPIDTAATVNGQPGIALGYHPAQQNGRGPQGANEAFYPLGAGNALQILVLDRQTLEEVQTWSGPANVQSLDSAAEFIGKYDDSKLVIMTAWASPGWSTPLISIAFTAPKGPAGLIGAQMVPQMTDQIFGPLEQGQMSFIGVPGFPAGAAWEVWGRPHDLTKLDGFLTPDNYLNYVYLGTAPQAFDLGPDGQSVTLSIGGSTYTAELNDGEGGFTVVYLDGKTLKPWPYDYPSNVQTQVTYQTRNADGSPNLTEMQSMANDLRLVSYDFTPPMLVAIRSIGAQPLAAFNQWQNQDYIDALNALASSVGDIGGLKQWIYGLSTAPQANNSYSLIGGNLSIFFQIIDIPGSGEGRGTDLSTAASPKQPSTRLSGLLMRRKDQGYEVRGTTDSAQYPMSPVLAQVIAGEAVAWPYAGSKSLQCIGNYLNFGPDPRRAYWEQPINYAWQTTQTLVQKMTVSDCKQYDPDYNPNNYSDFTDVQTEIENEILWLTNVIYYIGAVSKPFSDNGLSSYADLQTLTNNIKQAITPPPAASTGIDGWKIFTDLAKVAGAIGFPGAGLVASVINYAQDTYASGKGGPTTNFQNKVQDAADAIGLKIATQLGDAVSNGQRIVDIIAADYNKLSTVGQKAGCLSDDNPNCPPEWQFTQNQQTRASEAYMINAQRGIWGGMMAAAYPYVLMTNNNPSDYNGTFMGPQDQISGIGCDYTPAFARQGNNRLDALTFPEFLNYGIPQLSNYLFLVYSQTDFQGSPNNLNTNYPPASLFTPSDLAHPFEAIDPTNPNAGLGIDAYQFMVENWTRNEFSGQPPLRKQWRGCGN